MNKNFLDPNFSSNVFKNRGNLLTETKNIKSESIDDLSTKEIVDLFIDEDVIPQQAVARASFEISEAVDKISKKLEKGGRLFYIGAGTSGRLGVLDSAECPPTFCTDPELVQAIIAGGNSSLIKSSENLEDSTSLSIDDLSKKNFNSSDTLIGLTAGATTPYVVSALNYAKELGALSIAIACVPKHQAKLTCDIDIRLITGPELITGSTRLKAGTATKMALNIISTGVMIKLGKVYKHWMIDLSVTNNKLKDRAIRILTDLTRLERKDALLLLNDSRGSLKIALIMFKYKLNYNLAFDLLEKNHNNFKKAISTFSENKNNSTEFV